MLCGRDIYSINSKNVQANTYECVEEKTINLSKQEEMHMETKAQKSIQERNELVENNLKLAMFYAKSFIGSGVELDDLYSMGVEGLIHAAEKFDPSLGYAFSTYATHWIKQSIIRGAAKEGKTIRIPLHMNEAMRKIQNFQKEYMREYGEEPTMEQIVEATELTPKKTREALSYMYNVVSMDATVGEDGDTTMSNFIADEKADNPETIMVEEERNRAIESVLSKLDPKEAMVLKYRHGIGIDHAMTLEEIANLPEFMVTRERIRQIENNAYLKIKRSKALSSQLIDFVR